MPYTSLPGTGPDDRRGGQGTQSGRAAAGYSGALLRSAPGQVAGSDEVGPVRGELERLDAVKAFVVGARLGEPTFGLPQFQHDPSPWATLGVPSRALGISLILRRTGCRAACLLRKSRTLGCAPRVYGRVSLSTSPAACTGLAWLA